MNTTKYKVGKINRICIGYVGEKQVEVIQFDFSEWVELYGEGILTMLLKRPGDENPYPVTLEQADGIASWTVTLADTEIKGLGEGQLQYYVGDGLKKSAVFPVHIERSLKAAVDPPDPYETWIDTLTDLAAGTQQNAQNAEESAADAGRSAQAAAESAEAAGKSEENAGQSETNAAESAEAAGTSASNAEAWSVGQRGGVDVGHEDETYKNNSKFYSEMAAEQAAEGGYIFADLDDGDLYITYVNTDVVEFTLEEGDLYANYG